MSCQLRVLRLLLPARHRQVRLPAGREPVQQDAALHPVRPRSDIRPGNVPVRLSAGTTQCGTECCSGDEENVPAVTTARRAAHRARSAAREASARTTGASARDVRGSGPPRGGPELLVSEVLQASNDQVLLLGRVAGRLDRRLRDSSTCRRGSVASASRIVSIAEASSSAASPWRARSVAGICVISEAGGTAARPIPGPPRRGCP